ncbi:MAG: hypothetical protein JSR80_05460 [Verrucomicrobia bacterium]|nr:hypothetical protein [Verrucomicrobiota bacterium]
MNLLLGLVVFTANVLSSFNDPFEFEGDYGEEVNPTREYVFEQVVSKQTLQEDLQHGPTLDELVSPPLIDQLIAKQQALQGNGFSEQDLLKIIYFLNRYGNQKIFSLLRHSPSSLLGADKILRNQATSLPILSSTQPLRGCNALELKKNLMESLFTKEIFSLMKGGDTLDIASLELYLGEGADPKDLSVFTTPAGQLFFYWLYQSMNLHLISHNAGMIPQINCVKKIFSENLGNPTVRAQMFKDRLIAADASVVFTQESDAIVSQLLTENGLFHSVSLQNPADGTFVFLRSEVWEPSYQIIAIDDYEGSARGRLNVILAMKKGTGEKFLLAASHGNSTRAEDGRLQITKIVEKFHQLAHLPENKNLQLIIGIDANTKSDEEVALLRTHLDSLGLMATSVGPTTIKKRMVTTQHLKAGKCVIDEKDYIIILKPENGGLYHMTLPTVGFREEKADLAVALPNVDNPSDHYPVGTTLVK